MKNVLTEIRDLLASLVYFQKETLSFNEAVKYLDVSASYLYKCTSQGRITHFKPNNKLIYFKRQDLDTFLQRNKFVGDEGLAKRGGYCE
ncbi:helix-turn-helix domain-containing protein [Salinimicrobium sp. GXAS 041]|uniref:helix-turn-helix domain-containing protein n=1 Tax=Salinimicrobium sp. GXAS 041 TaxID=3400806 RepID=UPI003C71D4DA